MDFRDLFTVKVEKYLRKTVRARRVRFPNKSMEWIPESVIVDQVPGGLVLPRWFIMERGLQECLAEEDKASW